MRNKSFISKLNDWIYTICFGLSVIAIGINSQLEIQKLLWYIAILLSLGLFRWECTR